MLQRAPVDESSVTTEFRRSHSDVQKVKRRLEPATVTWNSEALHYLLMRSLPVAILEYPGNYVLGIATMLSSPGARSRSAVAINKVPRKPVIICGEPCVNAQLAGNG